MKVPTEKTDDREPGYFKIPIPSELRDGKITIGRHKISVAVQHASIDGFTILVPRKISKQLNTNREYRMEHSAAESDVQPMTFTDAPDGCVKIELRRIREIVENPEKIERSWLIRFGGTRFQDPSLAAALYGGLVLALFSMLALPGVGDHLGTADRIQDAFRWILKGVNQIL